MRPYLSCGCGLVREVPWWYLSWNGRSYGIESRQQPFDGIAKGAAVLDESEDSQSQVSLHSSAASSLSVLDAGTINCLLFQMRSLDAKAYWSFTWATTRSKR